MAAERSCATPKLKGKTGPHIIVLCDPIPTSLPRLDPGRVRCLAPKLRTPQRTVVRRVPVTALQHHEPYQTCRTRPHSSKLLCGGRRFPSHGEPTQTTVGRFLFSRSAYSQAIDGFNSTQKNHSRVRNPGSTDQTPPWNEDGSRSAPECQSHCTVQVPRNDQGRLFKRPQRTAIRCAAILNRAGSLVGRKLDATATRCETSNETKKRWRGSNHYRKRTDRVLSISTRRS